MRLRIGTIKGKWVNVHLLVNPDDPDHVLELNRFLARLTFSAHNDSFCCSKDDLIRLGRRFDQSLTNPVAALVSMFLEAKTKRQVIMVTHNANLVVNTDADQIIVAQVGPHTAAARI